MIRTAIPTLALCLMLSPAWAQIPKLPSPPTAPESNSPARARTRHYDVAVTGCVRGTRLVPSQSLSQDTATTALGASEFILEGPRELLRQIEQEYNGDRVEIAGTVTVPPSPTNSGPEVSTTKQGPVRFGFGSRPEAEPARPLRLKVGSITRLSEECVDRLGTP